MVPGFKIKNMKEFIKIKLINCLLKKCFAHRLVKNIQMQGAQKHEE